MARQNIPTQPKVKSLRYADLLGVDYQTDPTEINRRRSPEMVNMISDLGGNPVKRFGYRRIRSAYEGVASVGGQTWVVKKVGQGTFPETYKLHVVPVTISASGEITEGTAIKLSDRINHGKVKHVFAFQIYLYVLCEYEWYEYDTVNNVTKYLGVNEGSAWAVDENDKANLLVPDTKFIPTVYTMYKPNGRELITLPEGTDLTGATQGVNLLTPWRRVEYCVTTETASESKFVIPNCSRIAATVKVEILNWQTYEWKEVSSYTLSTVIDMPCARMDNGEQQSTNAVEAYVKFDSEPYGTRQVGDVTKLVFKDDNLTEVPSGIPNVRITYAPFSTAYEAGESREVHDALNINVTKPTYTISGTSSKTIALGSTPVGAIEVGVEASGEASGVYYSYFFGLTFKGGVASSGTESVEAYTGVTHHYTYSYNGNTEITISSSDAPSSFSPTVEYAVASSALNIPPVVGTHLSITYTRGSETVVESNFTAGTVETRYPYVYDPEDHAYYPTDGIVIVYDGAQTFSFYLSTLQGSTLTYATVTGVTYTSAFSNKYNGAYNKNRNAVLASDAFELHDARLFSASGIRAYYSRAVSLFRIDDNFYLDVDQPITKFAKTSSAIAIISNDTGKNTIYLASGAYDNNLAMTVYSTKASNAGVGALTSLVDGSLNDEPIFLANTGLFGISTNYNSEKYAVNRSGKINKHLTQETNLETAVGINHNNYFYLAINGHMYVLDSRHKDQSKNGDNSYESYYFDNMPNITQMFVASNRLYFSDGTYLYTWNDGLSAEYQYIDNALWDADAQAWVGDPVKAKWCSLVDDDGAPQYYKVLSKKGTMVTLSPPMQTSCQITIIKDEHDRYFIGRFNGATFSLSDGVLDAFTKKKIKKYKRLQFVVENNENEPFGIISVVKSFTIGNYAKR